MEGTTYIELGLFTALTNQDMLTGQSNLGTFETVFFFFFFYLNVGYVKSTVKDNFDSMLQ